MSTSTASTTQMTVSLRPGDLEALADVVARHAAVEKRWLAERRSTHRGLRGPALAAARQQLRAEREHERAAGRLLGTRDLVVAAALRDELTARGWDRNWSAPRPGAVGPGRRWGATAERYQHAGVSRFEARLTVRIPAQLVTRLQHAVHWESSAIEYRLQMLAGRPEHRAEIQRLQADLVTTGDVLRAAVRRAVG